jgi:hypothetical protein
MEWSELEKELDADADRLLTIEARDSWRHNERERDAAGDAPRRRTAGLGYEFALWSLSMVPATAILLLASTLLRSASHLQPAQGGPAYAMAPTCSAGQHLGGDPLTCMSPSSESWVLPVSQGGTGAILVGTDTGWQSSASRLDLSSGVTGTFPNGSPTFGTSVTCTETGSGSWTCTTPEPIRDAGRP